MAIRKPDKDVPVAVQEAYDFVPWLVKKVENFPRSYRFIVGERLTVTGLVLLTTLVEAAYARKKDGLLDTASQKVNASYGQRLATNDRGLLRLQRRSPGEDRPHVRRLARTCFPQRRLPVASSIMP